MENQEKKPFMFPEGSTKEQSKQPFVFMFPEGSTREQPKPPFVWNKFYDKWMKTNKPQIEEYCNTFEIETNVLEWHDQSSSISILEMEAKIKKQTEELKKLQGGQPYFSYLGDFMIPLSPEGKVRLRLNYYKIESTVEKQHFLKMYRRSLRKRQAEAKTEIVKAYDEKLWLGKLQPPGASMIKYYYYLLTLSRLLLSIILLHKAIEYGYSLILNNFEMIISLVALGFCWVPFALCGYPLINHLSFLLKPVEWGWKFIKKIVGNWKWVQRTYPQFFEYRQEKTPETRKNWLRWDDAYDEYYDRYGPYYIGEVPIDTTEYELLINDMTDIDTPHAKNFFEIYLKKNELFFLWEHNLMPYFLHYRPWNQEWADRDFDHFIDSLNKDRKIEGALQYYNLDRSKETLEKRGKGYTIIYKMLGEEFLKHPVKQKYQKIQKWIEILEDLDYVTELIERNNWNVDKRQVSLYCGMLFRYVKSIEDTPEEKMLKEKLTLLKNESYKTKAMYEEIDKIEVKLRELHAQRDWIKERAKAEQRGVKAYNELIAKLPEYWQTSTFYHPLTEIEQQTWETFDVSTSARLDLSFYRKTVAEPLTSIYIQEATWACFDAKTEEEYEENKDKERYYKVQPWSKKRKWSDREARLKHLKELRENMMKECENIKDTKEEKTNK